MKHYGLGILGAAGWAGLAATFANQAYLGNSYLIIPALFASAVASAVFCLGVIAFWRNPA